MAPIKRKAEPSADALDDDLEYEVDSDAAADLASIHGSESDREGPELDGSSIDGDTIRSKAVKKSKMTDEKRAKKKERKMLSKKRKLEEVGELEKIDDSILSTDQQADLFAKLLLDNPPSKDLSSLELADLSVPLASFVDSSDFIGVRDLSSIATFVEKYTNREDLKSSNKEPGRPHTLVLTASAIRVADLTRSFKHLNTKTATVVKLFGKEKLSKQAEQLQKSRVSVAVGVPARTLALLREGSLKSARIEQIYIDYTYKDSKKRGITKIKEVVAELMRLIEHDDLRTRLVSGECKIVLF